MSSDEDVHMTDEVEMGPDYRSAVRQYIVVDTNILIHRLNVVKALFQVVSLSVVQSAVHLLIPSIVIHELDNIEKSDKPEIRDQARDAMRYLLRQIQLRRSDELVPLRVQKQSEALRQGLKKPDDRILDCCLYFKPTCERMWLWTRDLNLNVAAEGNDVSMLPARTLSSIVDSIGIGQEPEVREEVQAWSSRLRAGEQVDVEQEGGMELDIDLNQQLPSFDLVQDTQPLVSSISPRPSGTLLDDYLARYPTLPSGDITPLSPSSASSSRHNINSVMPSPSSSSAFDQYGHLVSALQPLLLHLDVVSHTADRHLTALHDSLRQNEKAVDSALAQRRPPSDEQRILLEGISATRTLARFFESSLFDKERKPRVGQVVEAIEDIVSMCRALGMSEEIQAELQDVATVIRAR